MMRRFRGKTYVLMILLLASIVIHTCVANTCSASAIQSWSSRCEGHTATNRDFIPLTDMSSDQINIDDEDTVNAYSQARLDALKLSGAVGNAAMANMRRKSRSWYEQSLRKAMTFFCAETSSDEEMQRCVMPNSSYADRDITGNCIKLQDEGNCASKGMCERRGTCRWDDPIPGTSPRREFFTNANITTARDWMMSEYPKSFAKFMAPGIVFAVLTGVISVAFVVLRCVFNQCGGRNPREKGYTRCDILIPSVIFVACSAAVFICSVFTIAQNTNISDGVAGVINSLNVTLRNIDIYASNLQAPLNDIDQQLQSAKITVAAQMNDLEWITKDGEKLRQMIKDFGTTYMTQGPFPFKTCTSAQSTSCIVCPDAVCGAPLKSFLDNLQAGMSSTGGVVEHSVLTMQDAFVRKSNNLSVSIRTASRELSEISNLSRSSTEMIDVIQETIDDYSFSRSALVLTVFLFGMIASLLGLFAIFKGVCRRKSVWVHLLHVSWLLGVLVCILGFVLSSSLLAVGGLWYDSCNYMNILHADLTPYLPNEMSTILNACFNDSTILDPLHLVDSLEFQCELDDDNAALQRADFTTVPNLIAVYGKKVVDYGLRDFGFDPAVSRDLLAKANNAANGAGLGSKPFTADDVITPWTFYKESPSTFGCDAKNLTQDQLPTCYMEGKCASVTTVSTVAKDKCKELYTNVYYYALSFSKISDMLETMHEDLLGDTGKSFSDTWNYDVSLAEFAQQYFTKIAAVKTGTIEYLVKGEVGRVINSIERVRCSESCGWINISFNSVHDTLCHDILGTTLAISLCVFFLCVFLIPMIITGITLQKRLRGVKKGTYDELEKRLQQLEAKQREAKKAKKSNGIELFNLKSNVNSA